jgi:hypothetical protein
MKQKDAVFTAINHVLSENQVSFESGSDVSTFLTKEIRGQVTNILVNQFQSNEVDMDTNFATNTVTNTPKLRAYVSGLISNWVRKDTRLNGNIAYVPKNPGSRKGSGDPQLKALRALHGQATNDADRTEIQGFIDARINELQVAKATTAKLDISLLPEALVAKLNL